MKKLAAVLVLVLGSLSVAIAAEKPCEELKSEIVTKLEAKGVRNYQVGVITAEEARDQQIIGSCEGGRKRITYSKQSHDTASVPAQGEPVRPPPAAPNSHSNPGGRPPGRSSPPPPDHSGPGRN